MPEPTEAEFEDTVRRMDQENAQQEAADIASMPPLTDEQERLDLWRYDEATLAAIDLALKKLRGESTLDD